ncbi:MAG: hypothetical protein CMJ86_02820 [Planctomycetes bacterium]|jgi:prepilin-type N-terminal cleavage/methylation domain-containing protein|nr:hypothetical protein [Planctomycetota bacterium]
MKRVSRNLSFHRPPSRNILRRAGFTLIELIAVMAIIMILAVALLPRVNAAFEQAQVTACSANLGKIYQGLLQYHGMKGRWPRHTGVGFFAALVADEIWEDTETSTKTLSCPSVESDFLTPQMDGLPMGEWYTDLSRVDGSWSAYAGRDTRNHPLRKFPASGKVVLVADDNDPEGNHRIKTNALYGDGSVRGIDIVDERDEGRADEEQEFVIVGPDARREELRALTLD